jgi:DNA polymerase-3 subunit epsilon
MSQNVRQIVLDTETTGINPKEGHRVIEIGCIELIDRKLTGNTFHVYINPQREIEQEAINVHGITNEFLLDKPLFKNVVHDFIAFIKGAELIIHNAPFDVGFMNSEFAHTDPNLPMTETFCSIIDTLVMARRMRPGQKNSLDALCKFYQVDNSRRTYHGALLDSEILAEVYLYMTGGQTALSLNANSEDSDNDGIESVKKITQKPALKIIHATADNIAREQAIFG